MSSRSPALKFGSALDRLYLQSRTPRDIGIAQPPAAIATVWIEDEVGEVKVALALLVLHPRAAVGQQERPEDH
ncbi:hypothetical protein [Altererythrobacter sp. MTPC7]|uniref:hypothetical protein n=1 Tax=Altererythrobacter sp. MTPC7 TaxID=3056567 RepID=UPI0036F421DB